MSGVYIPGMEMPKSCFYCPFREKVNQDDYVCMALKKEFEETFSLIAGKRHKDCPLIPVPDHGRLIDKDVMCKECRRVAEEYDGIYPDCTYCPANLAPTIIPASTADKEGEG